MKMKHLLIQILIALAIAYTASGQSNIANQANSWYIFMGNHRISEKLGLHTEFQWRREDLIKTGQQSLLRFGLDYHADQANVLTAGYAWILTFPYGEQPVPETFAEHRLWEQWATSHRAGRFYINHRYRLEQRFLERPAEDRYVFRQRMRYRLLLNYPLGTRDWKDKQFFLAASAEPFMGFGRGHGKNLLDQNRLYFAIGYRFHAKTNLQVGYLNQYIIKTDGIHHERNHNFQIGFTHNLDFRG